jgi:hypothetical protein
MNKKFQRHHRELNQRPSQPTAPLRTPPWAITAEQTQCQCKKSNPGHSKWYITCSFVSPGPIIYVPFVCFLFITVCSKRAEDNLNPALSISFVLVSVGASWTDVFIA